LLISCKKIRWCYICEQLVKSKKSKYWIFQKSKYWIYQKLNVCGEKLFFYVICMKVFWISGTCKTPKWKRMRFELLISCKKIRWCYICEQLVTHMRVFWLVWFVWRVIQEKKKSKNLCGEKQFFYVICRRVFCISGTGKTPKWKRMRFELLISCKKIRWCYICEHLVKSKKSKSWIFQKS